MKYAAEISLSDFEFWSGARDTAFALTADELDTIESQIEEYLGENVTDTQINDLFWHDSDTIANMLGYDDWEDLEAKKAEEEAA